MSGRDRGARRGPRRAVAAVALCVSALGAASCGTPADESGDEAGATQEQPTGGGAGNYVGPYDRDFVDDAATLVDADVTLTARVAEVISPVAFTIAGAEETGTEALLVIDFDEDASGVDEGDLVEVTGTYREAYNVPSAEEDLRETPGAEQLAHYDGEPFVEATDVEAIDPAPTPSASPA